MIKKTTNETENDDEVIDSAIESISFFLFSVLSDCYPDLSTTDIECMFNEEFKIDVITFIKKFRNEMGNGKNFNATDNSLTQAYNNQRFFEKLTIALKNCQKDKFKKDVKYENKNMIMQ